MTINGFFAFLIVPPAPPFPEPLHNKNMCGVVWCYTGPMELAEATFKPIREQFPPALDFVGSHPAPSAAEHVRSAVLARAAVVLESGLCERAERRSHRSLHEARLPVADLAVHDAPLSGEWSGAPGRQERHGVELPGCQLGRGDRGRRSRSGEQGSALSTGLGSTGRMCIPIQRAARM